MRYVILKLVLFDDLQNKDMVKIKTSSKVVIILKMLANSICLPSMNELK